MEIKQETKLFAQIPEPQYTKHEEKQTNNGLPFPW